MTALAACWHFHHSSDARDSCVRMLNSQSLYAPGDQPVVSSLGSAALGRRLFRIVPEDAFDRGPLMGGDGRYMLVADLRLDNRDELLGYLALSRSDADRLSDAALFMKLWEQRQHQSIPLLVGDFALILWDEQEQRLLLARDFLGHRPLHFHRGDDFVAVASMPKGLHALAAVPYAPNPSRAADFLTNLPELGPDTFFAGVSRVEPGHICVIDRHGIRSEAYWTPDLEPLTLGSPGEYAEGLREKLTRATERALRGVDTSVACQLSGGMDSSSVLATVAPLMQQRAGRVIALTAVPSDEAAVDPHGRFADEGGYAALAAARFPNVDHVLVKSDAPSPLEDIDRNFFLYDSPIPNLANLGWWNSINDEVKRRGVKILLTGQLGNLTMSYKGVEILPMLLTGGRWAELARLIRDLLRNKAEAKAIASWTLGPFAPSWLWKRFTTSFDPIRNGALHPELTTRMEQRAQETGLNSLVRRRSGGPELRMRAMQRMDIGGYMKGVLAGYGIDVRDPTSDRELVEYCLRIPMREFIAGGVPGSLVRRAFKDLLPIEILEERRTGYQGADWYLGVQKGHGDIRMEIERLADCAATADLLNLAKLQSLVESWPEKGWRDLATERSYRSLLLRSLSVGHFVRKASGSNR